MSLINILIVLPHFIQHVNYLKSGSIWLFQSLPQNIDPSDAFLYTNFEHKGRVFVSLEPKKPEIKKWE